MFLLLSLRIPGLLESGLCHVNWGQAPVRPHRPDASALYWKLAGVQPEHLVTRFGRADLAVNLVGLAVLSNGGNGARHSLARSGVNETRAAI